MIVLNESDLKKSKRLQAKESGISTKNYVSHQLQNKKWLKAKQSQKSHMDMIETYYYNTVFAQLLRKQNRPSLLSISDLTISFRKEEALAQKTQLVYYYIERPFYTMSVKQYFQKDRKSLQTLKFSLTERITQTLKLFLESSEFELPLIVPSNILIKKQWNKKCSMHINNTSLVGYQFFVQGADIYRSKFDEIACYLHPRILSQDLQLNDCFTTRLYSFGMIVVSLVLHRQICFSSMFSRMQNTVNVVEIKDILQKNFQKIKQDLLGKKFVQQKISQIYRDQKGNKSLKKQQIMSFLEVAFRLDHESKPSFQSWTEVIDHFNSQFLSDFIQMQPEETKMLIKDLYQNEDPSKISFYKKMGIIHPQLSDLKEDTNQIQKLVIYFMLKLNDFSELRTAFSVDDVQKDSYRPKIYNQLIKLQQELRQMKEQKTKKMQIVLNEGQEIISQNRQSIELDISQPDEINLGLHYNVFMFEESQNVGDEQKRIYVPNEIQKSLDLFRSRIWL